jgi:beta-fructofuranosidase
MENLDAFLARVAADPQRPRCHFMPPANWMNDPNGLLYYEGRYHVFYQHNPYDATWGGRSGTPLYRNPDGASGGTMHWGHAVSSDLLHWQHLPIALTPTPGGPDKDGCFSGCAVVHDAVPTLLYTGVQPEVQCVATSRDALQSWTKYTGNPVIANPPEGLEVTGFRDPCVWKEGEEWLMLIGSGLKEVGGAALLYASNDLRRWRYLHPLCIGDRGETGTVWECPDFFPLGEKHVLLVSPIPLGKTLFLIGTYANRKFIPERQGCCDFGDFYAAKSLEDDRGRRLLWGWVWEGRSEAAQHAAGWAGALSLPRLLSLREDGALAAEPAPELRALRRAHRHIDRRRVAGEATLWLPEVHGDCLEIEAEFAPGQAQEVGLYVRCAPDESERTRIVYNAVEKRLTVERERSSLSPDVHREAQSGALALQEDEMLTLRVFLDRSLIEIYANGGACCLTSRIYPTRADSTRVGLFAQGGDAHLLRLEAWEMEAIAQSS